jgi:hypothetical protein
MKTIFTVIGVMALLTTNAKADAIIDVNASWAELNYQQVNVIDEPDTISGFDARARGFGLDFRFALAPQWAILVAATAQQECLTTLLVFSCSNDDLNEQNTETSAGWYKNQAVGVSWSWPFARRFALETSYRYEHEAFRLHDNYCYLWVCTTSEQLSNYPTRTEDNHNHLIGVGGRAQWGRYQLAVSAVQSLGDIDDTLLRLENRFLVASHLNLVLSFQGGDQRKSMSFGVAARW